VYLTVGVIAVHLVLKILGKMFDRGAVWDTSDCSKGKERIVLSLVSQTIPHTYYLSLASDVG
jgi:hypothetical protein